MAPYLTLAQLDFLLAEPVAGAWPPDLAAHLARVKHLRTQASDLSENYGGWAFLPQSHRVGFFHGEALRATEAVTEEQAPRRMKTRALLGTSLLGPADVACLLRSIVSAPVHGHQVQKNMRLLLTLLLSQPASFLRAALYETGGGAVRNVTHFLMHVMQFPQDRVPAPIK